MPLSIGDKLGQYEALSLLGRGGMGEVYKARDTTLKRDVALKVLPETLLADQDRLARFQREAEVLASLDHPNIGSIFGLIDSAHSRALVLSLIEGPTLADQIALGALPVKDALNIARQIIEALEYAHDRGVVHRDLKPANIKITPEGAVKVLDFGLAKVLEDEPKSSSLPNSPTMTLGHTRAGVILGTAAYMSPEQAVGRPVDRRSDIFSFAAVLYEMLTGQRAFTGAATPDVLEAVVKNDPDWAQLPPGGLEKVLRRCLVKDRKQRFQAIGEVRIALENVEQVPARSVEARAVNLRHAMLAWAAAAALAITTVVALWAPWRTTQAVDRPLVRLDVDLGADVSLPAISAVATGVAISPDGTRLAYISGNPPKLFTRRLDQAKATELGVTDGTGGLYFSTDGQWIGFPAGNDGKLNKVSVEGGAAALLAGGSQAYGADWGEDGSIVRGQIGKGLLRIPGGGGPPETLTELGDGELAQGVPQILPGGKAILFTSGRNTAVPDQNSIQVLTLADHHRKVVARGGAFARYAATWSNAGHLLYSNRSTLFAIPFDLTKLETHGTAVPVLDDVGSTSGGIGPYSFSRTGTLVYRRGGASATTLKTVHWVDLTGKKEPLGLKPGRYQDLSLSPDGTKVGLMVSEGGNSMWVYDPQRDAMTRLTFEPALYLNPIVWSPDGQYIVFGSMGSGILRTRADGANQPQVLLPAKNPTVPSSFTSDGKRLAYYELVAGATQIWTVPLKEQGGQFKAGKPEQFLKSSFNDYGPSFSPDGRWLAYASNESGKAEVYVRAFPPPASGQGGKWQVSNNGGTSPMWRGRELRYRSRDGQLMSAGYTVKGDAFLPDKPRAWIAKPGNAPFDITADGKRVAVIEPLESTEAPKPEHEIVMLQNFFDYLRQRVPVGK